jgi:endoglucanase
MFGLTQRGSGCGWRRVEFFASCLCAAVVGLMVPGVLQADDAITPQITVDQFGWPSGARKVAILAEPVRGQNVGSKYRPGPRFEVCNEKGGAVVYRGETKPWNGGKVSELAGDRIWHADFSGLRTPGSYYLHDPVRKVRSFSFRIADDVYRPVLRDSVRTFYYQRSGTAIPARYGGDWHHEGGHLGRDQDRAAQYSQGGKALGQPRDVLGGWFDAGDMNKYVPYLESTLFDLLWAYELNPRVFGDDTNIPESGNGVADLLDEIKWELDWLFKMQDTDGGVFNRVAGRSFNSGPDPPESDKQPRLYSAKTTWATATAAATFAHAARVYDGFDRVFAGYSARLRQAAQRAWAYLEAHPELSPADGSDGDNTLAATPAGSNANGDRRSRVYAAAELYKTLGEKRYQAYVDRWAADVDATADNGQHPFKGYKQVDPLNHGALTQGLFIYATTKGASPAVVRTFQEALSHTAEAIRAASGGPDDPYLAYHYEGHYCWGSNQCKGRWGRVLSMAIALGLNREHHREYHELIAGYVHFIHGRNPLSLCFLTNMGQAGADRCPAELFHFWFHDGSPLYDGAKSRYGPAPGYLEGGPNKFFTVDWISPPHGEPPMKAYRDWNTAWNAEHKANESSWEITEPAIYYQAAYTLLLSQFVPAQ